MAVLDPMQILTTEIIYLFMYFVEKCNLNFARSKISSRFLVTNLQNFKPKLSIISDQQYFNASYGHKSSRASCDPVWIVSECFVQVCTTA